MKKPLNLAFKLICCSALALCMASCSSTKKTKYFQDIPDSGKLNAIGRAEYIEPRIQIDDIISVVVQTIDPQASGLLNAGGVSGANVVPAAAIPVPNLNSNPGYLVDKEGYINIIFLGRIKVAGLTITEARRTITDAANKYYKQPTVIVRFANFKINVGGEVNRPGSYVMPNEKVTVLDALSMAGDLTIFGKRDNVLLIRENLDGTKVPYRINLKKSDFMTSPYYYLRQNDYIYVEPDKGKAAATDAAQTRNYSIAGSVLSIIAIILTRR